MASIRTAQTEALMRMLELHREPAGGGERAWHDPWKIFVYDAYCRDIIAPLLRKPDLRKRGITLNLLLDEKREAISDVPAIYFLQPTAANVRRLGDDCRRALYESYYINFTPAVPRPLLEELAAVTLESDSVAQISRVTDQYLNFASAEEDFFTLLLPQSYVRLHDPSSTDTVIEGTIEAIVNGLFSAVVTLGAVPILRYLPTDGPAKTVAEQLGRRLHDQLKAHPQLFSEGQATGFQRPLLVIADRAADLSVMLQHCWTYAPLCHDLLGLRLNKVKLTEPPADGGAPKDVTYDLNGSDGFWAEHMGAAFQEIGPDVERELTEYRAKMDAINSGAKLDGAADSAALADTTRALRSTMSQLPELKLRKGLIDTHTNIATALLGHIRDRSLDTYYAIEEAILDSRCARPTGIEPDGGSCATARCSRASLMLMCHSPL